MNSIYRYFFLSMGVLGTGSGILTWLTQNGETAGELISAITAGLNILAIVYFAWTRNRGEVKKLEAEGESEIVEAAHSTLEGAKISSEMLKERIDELKRDVEAEKQARRHDAEYFMQQAEYFMKRIKDIEDELRDYRVWATKLVRQVIASGVTPEQFISSKDKQDELPK